MSTIARGLWFSIIGVSLGIPEDMMWSFRRSQFPIEVEAEKDFLGEQATKVIGGCFRVPDVRTVVVDTRYRSDQLVGVGLEEGIKRGKIQWLLLQELDRCLPEDALASCLLAHPYDQLGAV